VTENLKMCDKNCRVYKNLRKFVFYTFCVENWKKLVENPKTCRDFKKIFEILRKINKLFVKSLKTLKKNGSKYETFLKLWCIQRRNVQKTVKKFNIFQKIAQNQKICEHLQEILEICEICLRICINKFLRSLVIDSIVL